MALADTVGVMPSDYKERLDPGGEVEAMARFFGSRGLQLALRSSRPPSFFAILDAEKAQRIKLDGGHSLYEWQFHWVAERLAILFARFAQVVKAILDLRGQPIS